jgi:hypothetical protein
MKFNGFVREVFIAMVLLQSRFITMYVVRVGHVVAQWLRHCTTNWKVVGSILDGVIGIFH